MRLCTDGKKPMVSVPNDKCANATNWLPAPEERDFRSLTGEERRFVCMWEYSRSLPTVNRDSPEEIVRWIRGQNRNPGKGSKLYIGNYLCSRAHDLSKPYLAIKNEAFKKLSVSDIKRPDAFIQKLRMHGDPVSEFLWKNLSGATQEMLQRYGTGPVPESLVEELNKLLYQDGFYNEKRFAGVPLKIGHQPHANNTTRRFAFTLRGDHQGEVSAQ